MSAPVKAPAALAPAMQMQGTWSGQQISGRPTVQWSLSLDAPVEHLSASDSQIFAVTGGALVCLDHSGEVQWDTQLSASGKAVLTELGVAVPTESGVVQVLDLESGSILQSYGGRNPVRSSLMSLSDTLAWVDQEGVTVTPTSQSPARIAGPVSGAASNGELIIAGNASGSTAAYSHGGVAWTQDLPGSAIGYPIIDEDNAYFAFAIRDGEPGGVAALTLSSGALAWVTHFRYQPRAVGSLGEHLVVPADNAELIALDLTHGGVRWRAPSPAVFGTQPAIVLDSIYTGDVEGRVQRVEMADGGTVWSIELGAAITAGPVITDRALVVGTADGRLVMLAAQ